MAPPPERLPSLAAQKAFIERNGGILDDEARRTIYQIVALEAGRDRPAGRGVIYRSLRGEVSVNLDNLDNPEVVGHIYSIVANRLAALQEPAGRR